MYKHNLNRFFFLLRNFDWNYFFLVYPKIGLTKIKISCKLKIGILIVTSAHKSKFDIKIRFFVSTNEVYVTWIHI